ncbi:hypothetical protein [Microbacterium thalli]|uniref:hypothetical protein n=1 Tax=Microbacterium thalli TaxID=3027921 RepID=UPI002366B4BE|nr:hypothetical protein [Microbacterium thalli]MDD7930789.1 hypothetical protein [Microbacterium thalli]
MAPDPNRPLQSFSADGEDVILSLAVSWAGAVREQLHNVRHRVAIYNNFDELYERNDGDVTMDQLAASWQAAWTAEALLVISADNLERWIKRLYTDRGREPRAPHPQLRALRNAVEHMDESEFDDDWIARPGRRQERGLGALPEASLPISTGDRTMVFGLIPHDELASIVTGLIGELDREIADYAQDMIAFYREDR